MAVMIDTYLESRITRARNTIARAGHKASLPSVTFAEQRRLEALAQNALDDLQFFLELKRQGKFYNIHGTDTE